MEATTGPLITHQRAVFSFVSQHLEEEEGSSTSEITQHVLRHFLSILIDTKHHRINQSSGLLQRKLHKICFQGIFQKSCFLCCNMISSQVPYMLRTWQGVNTYLFVFWTKIYIWKKYFTQCHESGASELPRQSHKWWEFLQ